MTENRERSVAQTRRGVTVEASPFNGVKLELGLVVLVLVGILVYTSNWVADATTQMLIILGASLVGSLWLVIRIRQVIRKSAAQSAE